MKKITIILITFSLTLAIVACDGNKRTTQAPKTEKAPSELTPKTINKQEVARIALIQVEQIMKDAKNKKELDLSQAQSNYEKAQLAYDNGDYKEAQKKAVDARHLLEKLLMQKK